MYPSCRNAEIGLGLICACLPAVTALYTRRKGGSGYQSGYHSGAYGNRSKGYPDSSAAGMSKNKIYVNHSIHIGTVPRGEDEEARAGSADQWSRSQDQIELVTNAQGISESKWT